MTVNIEHYLTLHRTKLAELPFAERIELLNELTRQVPTWLAAVRAEEIDQVRDSGKTDAEIAEMLGVERQGLSRVGDGPAVQSGYAWIKPQLLKRTAEILAAHEPSLGAGPADRELQDALQALGGRGRPNQNMLRGAARRIALAGRYSEITREDLPAEQWRTLRRGLAHAAQVH